jgi:hypothetical protein
MMQALRQSSMTNESLNELETFVQTRQQILHHSKDELDRKQIK